MPKKSVTVVTTMNAEELRERFGTEIRSWLAGAKIRVFGADRHVGFQSPHLEPFGVAGCWELAATLKIPIAVIEEREAWQ